ncbi:MAG: hypothetical protein WCJ49_05225 [Deltaproteobacteria bacterium]|nr:hypothetical protein [Methanoregula sp.]
MDVDAFTQNIRLMALEGFKKQIKNDIEPKIENLTCKQCNLQKYSFVNFSDGDNTLIARLKCTNCGFEDDFTIHLQTDEFEGGLKSIKNGMNDLQNKIEDINRRGPITIKF